VTPLERVIDKVRKLRALSTSSNAFEAAAAAAAAERLLLAHELTEAEIARHAPPARDACAAAPPLDSFPAHVPRWRSHLAAYLARIHGCATWLDPTWDDAAGRATWALRVAGRPGDVAIVRDLYTWLAGDVARLVAAAGGTRSARNAFAWGAVLGIHEHMDRVRAELRAAAPWDALVFLEERITEAAAAAPAGLRYAGKPTPVHDGEALERGRRAGAFTAAIVAPEARPRRS
jgi:hypothetical protein